MDWRDEGLLLGVKAHGEGSAVLQVLTAEHGRHAGLVRGARSRAMAPVLQPGAQLSLDWRGRLADHLGTYRVEPVATRAALLMADRVRLAAFTAAAALLIAFLPEREPNPDLYRRTVVLADRLAAGGADGLAAYARWELGLLGELGFPLDLSACAMTGATGGLAFVSPRTGRAVTAAAGADWADRLLPLPGFLAGDGAAPAPDDLAAALALTGHFLDAWVRPAFDRERLPDARLRLGQAVRALASRPPAR